jgi:hypothetical protein
VLIHFLQAHEPFDDCQTGFHYAIDGQSLELNGNALQDTSLVGSTGHALHDDGESFQDFDWEAYTLPPAIFDPHAAQTYNYHEDDLGSSNALNATFPPVHRSWDGAVSYLPFLR